MFDGINIVKLVPFGQNCSCSESCTRIVGNLAMFWDHTAVIKADSYFKKKIEIDYKSLFENIWLFGPRMLNNLSTTGVIIFMIRGCRSLLFELLFL